MADDSEPDWQEDDEADADNADIFVEVKTALFLKAVGLTEPAGYWD